MPTLLPSVLKKFFFIGMLFLTTACSFQDKKLLATITKLSASDPFKETIAESQFFTISGKSDQVVEGKNGTRIVIPKGAFKNSNGEVVSEDIRIELAEALTLDEMVLSNLTTTSGGKLLETDGMIFLNATHATGEQLVINKENPLYIEIPTKKKKAGMQAYKGTRDDKGNMNWTDPKELDNFLIPVDMHLLDFYPEGFEREVENGMPFRKHKMASSELKDSLYYSLSISQAGDLIKGLNPTDYNEAYSNPDKKIIDGKYTKESFVAKPAQLLETGSPEDICNECGIDPAIIKAIKSKRFEKSFIATREFETRLQTIFKTCQNSIIANYITNLDKNLWELDEISYKELGSSHPQAKEFKRFAEQKLTNVKGGSKYAAILKSYYEKQLVKIKEDLQRLKIKQAELLEKKNDEVEKVAGEYREVLWKREKYRMETYGFTWTNNGWINIDIGIAPKEWESKPLEFIIQKGEDYDRIHNYVVYTSIKSIQRLNESGNILLMPKNKLAYAISIAYKGEQPFLAVEPFQTGTTEKVVLALEKSSTKEIKKAIGKFKGYEQENQIDKDLEYQEYFYKEEVRQQQLRKEEEFIQRLREKAFPCSLTEEEPALN